MASCSSTSSVYYFIQSPYMHREMQSTFKQRHNACCKKMKKQKCQRLLKQDKTYTALVDESRRVQLSQTVLRALPIMLFWNDGCKRMRPFRLLKSILSSRSPSPSLCSPLIHIMGGSLGLDASILDDKCRMNTLLHEHSRAYIPETYNFHIKDDDWKQCLQHQLNTKHAHQYIFLKPAAALKQKGILVCKRDVSSWCLIESHIMTELKHHSYYLDWVMQVEISYPFMMSGWELGKLSTETRQPPFQYQYVTHIQLDHTGQVTHKEQPTPVATTTTTTTPSLSRKSSLNQPTPIGFVTNRTKSISRTSSSTTTRVSKAITTGTATRNNNAANIRTSQSRTTSASPSKPTTTCTLSSSQPNGSTSDHESDDEDELSSHTHPDHSHLSQVATSTQWPSDSGYPIDHCGMYKCHFRVYAMVAWSESTQTYSLYACSLFKLYATFSPQAHIKDNQLIYHTAYDRAHPDYAISRELGMRLGNDFVPPHIIQHVMPHFYEIIRDTCTLAIQAGGMTSFNMACTCFQILGYDFLWDMIADKPVLLEINNNVGQGIHKRHVMCPQGMTSQQYMGMKQYWGTHFRIPFCEGIMKHVVDPYLGITSSQHHDNVWVVLGTVPKPPHNNEPNIACTSTTTTTTTTTTITGTIA